MRTLRGRCRRVDLFTRAHKCTDGQNRTRRCRVAIHGDRQTALSDITPLMATPNRFLEHNAMHGD